MGIRLRWIGVAVALAAAVCVCAGSAGASGVRASGVGASRQIVFYSNLADSVPGTRYNRNSPRVRPTRVLMFADGSWVIEKLRWSSWGGAVARATGISSASTGVPDQATAPRIKSAAELVVSHPERLLGRELYGCYQLTDPSYPRSDQHECLKHSYGNQYDYSPVGGLPVHLSDFLSPDRKIWCSIWSAQNASCGVGGQDAAAGALIPNHSAQVGATGQVKLCNWAPGQNPVDTCVRSWNSGSPVLRAGWIDLVYQYRCTSTASSVTCTVNTGPGKGNGFRITPTGVKRIP
jgi:hypothetical protein